MLECAAEVRENCSVCPTPTPENEQMRRQCLGCVHRCSDMRSGK